MGCGLLDEGREREAALALASLAPLRRGAEGKCAGLLLHQHGHLVPLAVALLGPQAEHVH
jgi:hypothetical protein